MRKPSILLQDRSELTDLEAYFLKFRKSVIGIDQEFTCPLGVKKKIVYADWTASGRLYDKIEDRLRNKIFPFVANTHTETNITGKGMTLAYHKALRLIKKHVNANEEDVIISCSSGMTGVVNKFQRILGLKIHEKFKNAITFSEEDKPVVFISHMEHHSNQTSWLETIADVVIIHPDDKGLLDLDYFATLLERYNHRKTKIAALTSCSNVTGLFSPYYQIAEMIHKAGGLCFVDFACSAPYININMHPDNPDQRLDAIYFSPHKFLGGPGSSGVLIFKKDLYNNSIPDNPGGGTVDWTNPWGEHKYVDDIEAREDGGTPSFLQTIKVALCINLKNEMGVDKMLKREEEQLDIIWYYLDQIPNLHILADRHKKRLGVVSFYIDNLHYNVGVKILNDRYGIQVRGGCSCAGTYGHYLLHVEKEQSRKITDLICEGDFSEKPGWIRMSIHPTMSNEEIHFIGQSITELANRFHEWQDYYTLDLPNNEVDFCHPEADNFIARLVDNWLDDPLHS